MNTAMLDARSDLIGCRRCRSRNSQSKRPGGASTETVYGLAGDALEPEAVAKIFEAKERPSFDPLIIHIENKQWLTRLTRSLRKGETHSESVDGTILARTANDPLSKIRSGA